jgi:SH3 domain protein
MRVFQFAVVSAVLLAVSQPAWSGTEYVTDSFRITLRVGPGTEHKIIDFLKSGQPVEVLEASEKWSRVRVLDGGDPPKEGWVISRYLIQRRPWEREAEDLRAENERLREQLAPLETETAEARRKETQLTARLKETALELEQVQKAYETLKRDAKNFLELREKFRQVNAELQETANKAKALEKENDRLHSSQRARWFATGALVLFVGLVFGLILGRQQKRRRSLYY